MSKSLVENAATVLRPTGREEEILLPLSSEFSKLPCSLKLLSQDVYCFQDTLPVIGRMAKYMAINVRDASQRFHSKFQLSLQRRQSFLLFIVVTGIDLSLNIYRRNRVHAFVYNKKINK